MRTAPVILLLLLVTAVPAFAQHPSNHLEGSWRLISQREVWPDSVVARTPPPSMKILNSTHFAWGFQTEDGEEVLAGGGRYELMDDSTYVEHIEYHTSPPLVGASIRFKATVVGDSLWYHVGSFPSGFTLEEVWRRIR